MTARTLLGRLTKLAWKGGERAWSLRTAPWLVYDARGKLAIVYAAKAVRPATAAETREYARTHWGEDGARVVRDGVVATSPWTTLGVGTWITYTTAKGGDGGELADYEHEWGEGASGWWTPPKIVEHRCGDRRCEGHGRLSLHGGSYRVGTRGIVG